MRFTTRAIRVGQDPQGEFMPVIPPIHQSATFAWRDLDSIPKHDYTRCANPTRTALEEVIASLENGRHCVCFSSGMASIVTAFALLKSGDHVLVAADIYGGTYRVAEKMLPRQGIEASEFDAGRPSSLQDAVRPNTKMVIFETPTNPNLALADIKAIADEAHSLGLLTVVDNTFASPYLQTPLDLGIDIVVHSTTKYIGGHSDVIGGAFITNDDKLGEHAFEFNKMIGAAPSPFDCWLTLRGVKTLALRMERHCSNAQKVAEFLAGHPHVSKVYYPGLPSHPGHEIAKRQMKKGFGGMVAFEVEGGAAAARKIVESTKVFMLAESLGGVESIIGYPPLMSHGCMTEEQRLAMGVVPNGIRLSVGIEDIEDLIEDLDQAIAAAFTTPETRAYALVE
ncbi:MAG: trans-sulfuration enzyme family protein [Fimbriimonadales bacterium]